MPFTSLEFALFFLVVLSINWALKSGPHYHRFLLVANLAFYGLAAPKFLPLLFIVGWLNWRTVKFMAELPQLRRLVLTINIILNLAILVFFKYFELLLSFLDTLGLIPTSSNIFKLPEIVYPVGLSFFTFQALSLAIDQYRQPDHEPPTLLNVLVFVTFFPTILAGPIQRHRQFQTQLTARHVTPENLNLGLYLIIAGLFKKVALSSYLSEHIVRGVFQVPDSYSAWGVLAGVYGYSAQIYLDFSGYSDLALGVALLMGIDVGTNFQAPYLATNIRDFWRRWHISLSTWLRDYLYIPLGGSRRGSQILNLLITQTLGGLWHGAHARYLVWGLAHGLGLAITHLFIAARRRKEQAWADLGLKRWQIPKTRFKTLKKWGGFLLTFNFVSFTWILFRAEDLDRALEIGQGALAWSRPGHGAPLLVWLIVALTLFGQATGQRIQRLFISAQTRLSPLALGLWLAFWVIVIIKLGPEGVLPFIYFQY